LVAKQAEDNFRGNDGQTNKSREGQNTDELCDFIKAPLNTLGFFLKPGEAGIVTWDLMLFKTSIAMIGSR